MLNMNDTDQSESALNHKDTLSPDRLELLPWEQQSISFKSFCESFLLIITKPLNSFASLVRGQLWKAYLFSAIMLTIDVLVYLMYGFIVKIQQQIDPWDIIIEAYSNASARINPAISHVLISPAIWAVIETGLAALIIYTFSKKIISLNIMAKICLYANVTVVISWMPYYISELQPWARVFYVCVGATAAFGFSPVTALWVSLAYYFIMLSVNYMFNLS